MTTWRSITSGVPGALFLEQATEGQLRQYRAIGLLKDSEVRRALDVPADQAVAEGVHQRAVCQAVSVKKQEAGDGHGAGGSGGASAGGGA